MHQPLAALVFDAQTPPDALIAGALARHPHLRVAGFLQYTAYGSCECRDILLRALHDGSELAITQNLGREAQGCRLDSSALADVAGLLMSALETQPDLLVLNRFGKSEAEGGGLRQVLEAALARDIPVLVPVNRRHLSFWQDYAGDMAEPLAPGEDALQAWLHQFLPAPV